MKDDDVIAVAKALPYMKSLTRLKIRFSNITELGVTALSESIIKNSKVLSELCLGDNIGQIGAFQIAKALPYMPNLTILALDRNNIGDMGAKDIADGIIEIPPVVTPRGNPTQNIVAATRGFINTGDLDYTIRHTKFLAAYLIGFSRNFVGLTLTNNKIGRDGAIDLAKALTFIPTLKSLHLGHNPLGEGKEKKGILALAKAFESMPNLTDINLNNTNLGRKGAEAIAKVLPSMMNLTSLFLSENKFSDNGMIALAGGFKSMPKQSVKFLELEDVKIGDSGAKAIAEALPYMKKLRIIGLRNNNISYIGVTALRLAVAANNMPNLELNIYDEDDDEEEDE
jgi:Ran GTPase-activating protein (RanGAP) involved in mRNA processing and transport